MYAERTSCLYMLSYFQLISEMQIIDVLTISRLAQEPGLLAWTFDKFCHHCSLGVRSLKLCNISWAVPCRISILFLVTYFHCLPARRWRWGFSLWSLMFTELSTLSGFNNSKLALSFCWLVIWPLPWLLLHFGQSIQLKMFLKLYSMQFLSNLIALKVYKI